MLNPNLEKQILVSSQSWRIWHLGSSITPCFQNLLSRVQCSKVNPRGGKHLLNKRSQGKLWDNSNHRNQGLVIHQRYYNRENYFWKPYASNSFSMSISCSTKQCKCLPNAEAITSLCIFISDFPRDCKKKDSEWCIQGRSSIYTVFPPSWSSK